MPDPSYGATTHITASGGLISDAFIETIREAEARQPGAEPASFALPWSPAPASRGALEAQIAAAWELLLERWDAVYAEVHMFSVSAARQRWLLPLFELLDFQPTYLRSDVVLDEAGKLRFPLSHRGWPTDDEADTAPILHTVPPTQKLDARAAAGQGVKARSPHDMLQAFVNAGSGDHAGGRWAVLTNGILLRLLREYHHTFTKGYIQFDLEAIFETRNYGDFRALYRLCHASRFVTPSPESGEGGQGGEGLPPLERFYRDSLATGVRVGDDLRDQVREAIETLGNGFLRNNPALLQQLTDAGERENEEARKRKNGAPDPASSTEAFYAEILHIIYRILFLLFAEQRGMQPGRDSLYAETYAIARLRARAEGDIPREDDFTDLWAGLQATFRMVREGAPALGVFGYNGMLFAGDQTPLLDGTATAASGPPSPIRMGEGPGVRAHAGIRNSDLLHAIRALTLIAREGVLQRISYADLGVEELGSIYESLLDYTPRVTTAFEVIDDREVPAHTFVLDPRGSERKTTGSYYTDDSLVAQLIKTALLPVAHDRLAAAGLPVIDADEIGEGATAATSGGLLTDYADLTAQQRAGGTRALLDLKVCDPAAGSGHFLVKANDALAAELARIRTGEPYPAEAEVQTAKRDVLAHCIYAVDLNPMAVELCKVSLWINASVRDQPLNFLDHHIKCGNSLVGATPALVQEGVPYEAFALGRAGDDRAFAKDIRKQNRQERRDFEAAGAAQLGLFRVTQLFEPVNARAWAELEALAAVSPQVARDRFETYQSDTKMATAKLLADAWTAAFFWPLQPDGPAPPTFTTFHELMLTKDPDALTPVQRQMVAALAARHRFFHWHLEFSDVFRADGTEKPVQDESLPAESGRGFDVLLGNPPWDVVQADSASGDLAGFERLKDWFGAKPYEVLKGRRDLYKLFVVMAKEILHNSGRLGFVIPLGMFIEEDCTDVRRSLYAKGSVLRLQHFQNSRKSFFPGVHASYRFVELVHTPKVGLTHQFSTVIRSPSELGIEGWVKVDHEAIEDRLGTDIAAVIYPNKRYADLHAAIIENLSGFPLLTFEIVAEFHATSDRPLTSKHQTSPSDWRLLKNRSIHQFDHQYGELGPYVPRDSVEEKCIQKDLDPAVWMGSSRLLFRDIARNDDARTLICCLAPPGHVSSYDTPMVKPMDVPSHELELSQLYMCGLLNSFLYDFLIRPFVDKHIKGYILQRLPVPEWRADPWQLAVAGIAEQLTELLIAGANDLAGDESRTVCDLRSRLEVHIARLAGVSREELGFVLETFPIIRSDEVARFGEYLTKRLALERYEEE